MRENEERYCIQKNNTDITVRSALYSSWHLNYTENDYEILRLNKEITMGQMFVEKFKNVIIIGLDHPKMGFYNIFDDVTAIYGRPKYA